MATLVPPPSKKQRKQAQIPSTDLQAPPENLPHVRVEFQAFDTGEKLPFNVRVPGNATPQQLELLLNELNNAKDDPVPYEFSLALSETSETVTINTDLYHDVLKPNLKTTEDQFTLIYTPRAVFKVKTITRSTGYGMGHGSTILTSQFSPNSSARLITGAGDATARIWNAETQTPVKTLTGHSDWVLAVSWSPDGKYVATASKDSTICVWDAVKATQVGKTLRGHTKFITSLCWEPYHLCKSGAPRLASSSKDATVRVWVVDTGICEYVLSGHKASVSCVKWGGFGDIYSTSHDKTVKVWSSADGRLVNTLQAHGHWVNHIALSTEFSLRSGPFDEKGEPKNATVEEMKEAAQKKFDKLASIGGKPQEKIVTASDDYTMFLWDPRHSTKPLQRMTGHQKLVNHVAFSPDGRYVASASFDNSLKLWDGRTGKFVGSLRGHVGSVYQCAWSADSRLLASCSKDTTVKIWDIKTQKLKSDLPGHSDEIYTVDWSLDGQRVCSGGKDKTIRFWTH